MEHVTASIESTMPHPLAIHCVDADNDAHDQSGILSDIGMLKSSAIRTMALKRHANGGWQC